MELRVTKTPAGLIPADEVSADALRSLPTGKVLQGKFTQPRNPRFHRKFFALLQVGFDAWEPPEAEYRGLPVQKNFDRFRKDCVIAAGYYEVVSNLRGEVRAEAKSISFGRMSEDEFRKLYSAVANVLLQRVLKTYTREDLDRVVDQIVGFC